MGDQAWRRRDQAHSFLELGRWVWEEGSASWYRVGWNEDVSDGEPSRLSRNPTATLNVSLFFDSAPGLPSRPSIPPSDPLKPATTLLPLRKVVQATVVAHLHDMGSLLTGLPGPW